MGNSYPQDIHSSIQRLAGVDILPLLTDMLAMEQLENWLA